MAASVAREEKRAGRARPGIAASAIVEFAAGSKRHADGAAHSMLLNKVLSMKPLPLTILSHRQPNPLLRPEYEWLNVALALATLGIGFSLWILFAFALAWMLGIPSGLPVRDQPNGLLWIGLSIVGLVFFVFVGYLVSFALLGAVLKVCYGWTWERVCALLLDSRLPSHWIAARISVTTDGSGGPGDAVHRARFVAQLGVLGRQARPWMLFVVLTATLVCMASFWLRSGSRIDPHFRWWLLLSLTAWSVIAVGWFWLIIHRHAPKCPRCQHFLLGKSSRQAPNSGQCPLCRQPLFS